MSLPSPAVFALVLATGAASLQAATPTVVSSKGWKSPPELRTLAKSAARPALARRTGGQITLQSGRTVRLHRVLPPVHDGRVTIHAVPERSAQALAADLKRLGMKKAIIAGGLVSGQLPVTSLARLDGVRSLNFARPAWMFPRTGQITSQGDIAEGAARLRTRFGFLGTGIKVGILSDSFDAFGDAGYLEFTGDLPNNVEVLEDDPWGNDEGQAMAEVVHDVAPGADIAFYAVSYGLNDLSDGIRALADVGCQVIVDDLGFLDEPMFADSVAAQAIDEVTRAGVSYFSAAGNDARNSFDDGFADSTTTGPLGGRLHNFAGGTTEANDTILNVRLDPGITYLILQWSQPYRSTSDASPGASTDLDFYFSELDGTPLQDPDTGEVLGGLAPNLGGDPIEVMGVYLGGTDSLDLGLRIEKVDPATPSPARLKLLWVGVPFEVLEYPGKNHQGTVFGHANAAGANAVGAVAYYQTPAYGVNPPLLESFSSAGGVPILFDPFGNALTTPEYRGKPNFCAPDGGNTTFLGQDYPDNDSWPNFYGTSASAPHAAGVAALLLQAAGSLTPAEVRQALATSAVDMGPLGVDDDTGAGLIRADLALESLAGLGVVLPTPVIVGDFDGDGCVGKNDLAELRAAIRAALFDPLFDPKYDVNGDGVLSAADARYLVTLFTHPDGSCP